MFLSPYNLINIVYPTIDVTEIVEVVSTQSNGVRIYFFVLYIFISFAESIF
jgi:hypothetical protein